MNNDPLPDWMPTGVLPVLSEFEGRPVLSTGIAIKGAGDGLSKALAIDPVQLRPGQVVYVVSECVVGAITFAPIKDTEGFQRVHSLKAGTSTIIDAAVVKDAIAAQAAKIETSAAMAKGEHKMPLPENLQEEHDAGGHADGLVAGCPACDAESDAVTEEAPVAPVRPIGSRSKKGVGA